MKKNEGFSLVELIVVVAIMAVLIGILAPAYLGYVEKTRKGTDENAAEEIRGAVEKAIAGDIDVYEEIKTGDYTFTDNHAIATTFSAPSGFPTVSTSKLSSALAEVFGSKTLKLGSKAYKGGSVVISVASSGNTYEVGCTINPQSGSGKKLK